MSRVPTLMCPCVRRPRLRAGALLLVFAVLPLAAAPAAHAERRSLSSIVETAQAGAPGLALELLEAHQPSATVAPGTWERWERARIRILAGEEAWERALSHLMDLPAAAPPEYRRWALERQAEVHLRRGDADGALAALRRLLWDSRIDAEAGAEWRQLVVRAYLAGDRVEDAVTAMRRYDQDYRDRDADAAWTVLRGRVLVRSGRFREALDVLPGDGEGEALALRLLAQLRAESRSPEAIIEAATAAADGVARADRARFHAVIVQAATVQGAYARRAVFTERAFADAEALPADDHLFRTDADAVWSAWLDWGQRVGNERGLLLGDDAAWLAAAEEALPRYRARARALLAVMALRGGDDRASAHERLLDELIEEGPGAGMARRLYLDSTRFGDADNLPLVIRYRLIDEALARDDLALATRLMRNLETPPADRDPFDWRLLRARVLVLGGDPRAGSNILEGLLDDHDRIPPDQLDRVLQVLFDLQGAREHERALELLDRIADYELDGQRRRELLYWQAESHQALGDHRRAAELYMRSATLLDGRGGDRWGQTARYHAAGQLARIGLVNDARRIYRVLLRVTEDPARRAQLRNRLQQLGLRESGTGDLPLRATE